MTPKTYMMSATMEGDSHEDQISTSNHQIINEIGHQNLDRGYDL
jgi:hypothetical protein